MKNTGFAVIFLGSLLAVSPVAAQDWSWARQQPQEEEAPRSMPTPTYGLENYEAGRATVTSRQEDGTTETPAPTPRQAENNPPRLLFEAPAIPGSEAVPGAEYTTHQPTGNTENPAPRPEVVSPAQTYTELTDIELARMVVGASEIPGSIALLLQTWKAREKNREMREILAAFDVNDYTEQAARLLSARFSRPEMLALLKLYQGESGPRMVSKLPAFHQDLGRLVDYEIQRLTPNNR